jgi:hypothetical protein
MASIEATGSERSIHNVRVRTPSKMVAAGGPAAPKISARDEAAIRARHAADEPLRSISTRAAHFSTQSVARYLSTGPLLTSRSRHPTS